MYPSLNNNGAKPQSISSLFINYYKDNIYSTTPQEHNHSPSSFSSSFLVPSPVYIPLEDEAVYNEFFQQQFFSTDHNHSIPSYEINNIVESAIEECSNNNGQIATDVEHDKTCPRKRRSNRDRHSKINTARGPRDRRIRLSLDVARKFFGLQDLLGFDMASKTLDWLLTRSETAILDLFPNRSCSFMGVSNSVSSTSECEVVSGTGGQFMIKTGDDQGTTKRKGKSCSESSKKQNDKITKVRKCADSHHPLAKETRLRARQRARERTTEKMNNYKHGVDQDSTFRLCIDQVMDEDVNQLGSWSTFQECQHQMSMNFQSN